MTQEATVQVHILDGYYALGDYEVKVDLPEKLPTATTQAQRNANLEVALVAATNEVRRQRGKGPVDDDPKPPARQVASQAKAAPAAKAPAKTKRAPRRKRATGPSRAVKES